MTTPRRELAAEPSPAPGNLANLAVPGTIASLLVLWWFLLSDSFFYANDDLLQFKVADAHGLSWETLSFVLFQHFAPVNRLSHLVVLRIGDLSPTLAFAIIMFFAVAMLLALAWWLYELELPLFRRVVALLLVGLSITLPETLIWFDSGMHILPALAVTFAVLAAHAQAVRTSRARWHVITFVIFAIGPLAQERTLFALPLIVLMDVLLLWRTEAWRTRWARLWALRRPLGALTAYVVAVAALLRTFVFDSDSEAPSWGTTLETILTALTSYVVPSFANVHPGIGPVAEPVAPLSLVGQLAVLVALLAVGVVLSRLDPRHNGGPLLFMAAVFALYYGFLKFSPLLTPGSSIFNASRLHNVIYVTIPVVVALVHLRMPGLERFFQRAAGRRRGRRLVAVVAIIATYMTMTGVMFLDPDRGDPSQVRDAGEARAYLNALQASAPLWSGQDVTVVPLYANRTMTTAWAGPYGRHDQLLPLIVQGWTPGDLTDSPIILDSRGEVQPVLLRELSTAAVPVGGACASTGVPDTLSPSLPGPVRGEALFAEISYTAAEDSSADLTTVAESGRHSNLWPASFAAGRHIALFPLETLAVNRIFISQLDPGSDLCISSLRIVRPVLPEEGGNCRYVDLYGRPSSRTECPSRT